MADQEPIPALAWYEAGAEAWAAARRPAPSSRLAGFMTRLPAGARVLELGCGAGDDAAALLAAGFDVTATDGSTAMAQIAAARLGHPVQVMTFDALAAERAFDAVWANACLLHVPRAALPDVLARIHRALKPGGVHFSSYKSGTAEGMDRFGRFYNYLGLPDLLDCVAQSADWQVLATDTWIGGQHGGGATGWIGLTLRRALLNSAEDQPGDHRPKAKRREAESPQIDRNDPLQHGAHPRLVQFGLARPPHRQDAPHDPRQPRHGHRRSDPDQQLHRVTFAWVQISGGRRAWRDGGQRPSCHRPLATRNTAGKSP